MTDETVKLTPEEFANLAERFGKLTPELSDEVSRKIAFGMISVFFERFEELFDKFMNAKNVPKIARCVAAKQALHSAIVRLDAMSKAAAAAGEFGFVAPKK